MPAKRSSPNVFVVGLIIFVIVGIAAYFLVLKPAEDAMQSAPAAPATTTSTSGGS